MTVKARTPRLAVLLPVYDGEKYVAEAIRSILDQTFADFDLIAIDDGSTDRSREILDGFSDSRLRIIRFPEHRGLVTALNRGIRGSRSELIVRMDADDICMPQRFERQVAFMNAHPEIAVCGTWTRQFGDKGGVLRPPIEPEQIRARLFFEWAMDHPSIMMRRAFLDRHKLGYDDEFRHVEDLDFFLRASALGNLANVPEVLMRTRAHAGETSIVHRREQAQTEARLRVRQLRLLMPLVTKMEEEFHIRIMSGELDPSNLPRAEQWLLRLDQANRERALYDGASFQRELRRQSYRLHAQAIGAGPLVLTSYRHSPLAARHEIRVREYAALIIRLAIIRLLTVGRACKKWLRLP